MSRADFEELCESLFARAAAPLDEALAKANITYADVTALEVHTITLLKTHLHRERRL